MDVILVDEHDNPVGTMGKLEVHEKALLHRAFSIFIFNDKSEMLLQKRSDNKYHSAGLWTNTCCSHPKPGEDIKESAQKRLQEEMGFITSLDEAFSFLYKAPLQNGLTEHEYDHVFIGLFNGLVKPNPREVSDYCYLSLGEVKRNIQSHPHHFTEWFKIALPKLEEFIDENA